jgi:type VII secretion protein EccE
MTARIALALLYIVPAVMAYPWPSTADRWVLGVAVAAVLVLFAWWRGQFLTTMLRRRLAMLRRRNRTDGGHRSSDYTTVVLRVDPSDRAALPLRLIADYFHRYGVRCDKVRVTSRDTAQSRVTWVGLTIGAADNLDALRARSPRIPLRDTAEVAARRLADHLREMGWNVAIVDSVVPPTDAGAKETWRGMRDGSGYVTAYGLAVDNNLAERLAQVPALGSAETWTALEFTKVGGRAAVSAVCAVRSDDKPRAAVPIPGLTLLAGRQRPAIAALNPLSVERLEGKGVAFSAELLDQIHWPTARSASVPV